MHKYFFAFVVFSIVPNKMLGQESVRKNLQGKVSAYANNLSNIYIINIQTEENAITEDNGYFNIRAKVGDTLMFTSTQFKGRKLAIAEDDFSSELLLVKLQPAMNQLQEVQIYQYKNINAVALGIIPKGQRTYTPAERKLKSATATDAQFGLNTVVTIDPLFNFLSGRTAELKKNLIIERKEALLAQIEALFEKEYFTEKLKIPEEHVKGFQYYIVENPRFVQTLYAKNKSLATFLMGELATKYAEIIATEEN